MCVYVYISEKCVCVWEGGVGCACVGVWVYVCGGRVGAHVCMRVGMGRGVHVCMWGGGVHVCVCVCVCVCVHVCVCVCVCVRM